MRDAVSPVNMHSLTIYHDSVPYRFRGIPESKYLNWRKVQGQRDRDANGFHAAGFPFILQVEPSNLCNLRCPLCPVARKELKREPRNMTLPEFRGIIDDMQDYLLLLVMWDWGEPFMNPDFPAMIRYAAERGIQSVTSTNAHFLDNDDYLAAVLTSGLANLIVAIDSLRERSYGDYRQKGNLGRALAGLEKAITMKRKLGSKTMINLRMVVMKNNETEIRDLRSLARRMGADIFTVKTANPSCGNAAFDDSILPDNPALRRFRYKPGTFQRVRVAKPSCSNVWTMCNIHSNGNVVPCFFDFDASMKVGNAFETPVSRLWNGPAYLALRRRVWEGRDLDPKCLTCMNNFEISRTGVIAESYSYYRNGWEHVRSVLRRFSGWKNMSMLKMVRRVLGGLFL